MPIIKGNDGIEMVWFTEEINQCYIIHISRIIKNKFGKGSFNSKEHVNLILNLLFKELIDQAKFILNNESSLAFYQYIQVLHEDSNKVVIEHNLKKIFPECEVETFYVYRRVLKFIIEQSTCILLIPGEPLKSARIRCLKKLEELIHIGYLLFSFSNLQASIGLLGNYAVEVFFNEDSLYNIDYKYPINEILIKCSSINKELRIGAIFDQNGHKDFNGAFKKIFGAEIFYLVNLVEDMHREDISRNNELYPQASSFELKSLVYNYAHNTGITKEIATEIISGLILSETTKCTIEESIFQPHNIRRHLFRPIIQWKILDHPKMVVVGKLTLQQCLNSLAINAIGWEKFPPEWNNNAFRSYVLGKKRENGMLLENIVEQKLKKLNLIYDRNIKSLIDKNGQGMSIENDACGEVDFIFIKSNIIYICDSKYLLDKHDFNNWKGDYNKFVDGKNNYNDKLLKKKAYLENLKARVFEHLEYKSGKALVNKDYLIFDVFFIVNTPTFYMFNSPIDIIPITAFERKIKGEEIFPPFKIETGKDKYIEVTHPYFKLK